MSDLLPDGAEYVSDNFNDDLIYDPDTGVWNVPGILPGDGTPTQLLIVVKVLPGFGSPITNTAMITVPNIAGDDPGNNSDSGAFDLPPVDLDISKSANPEFANEDTMVQYTVDIINTDTTNDATNVMFMEIIASIIISGAVLKSPPLCKNQVQASQEE